MDTQKHAPTQSADDTNRPRKLDHMSATPDSTPPATTATRPASGSEIAGFVVSIIALLTSVIGGGFLLGIIALVIIGVSRRRTAGRSSLGRAAVIIGVIAIVLGALFAIRAGIAAMGA